MRRSDWTIEYIDLCPDLHREPPPPAPAPFPAVVTPDDDDEEGSFFSFSEPSEFLSEPSESTTFLESSETTLWWRYRLVLRTKEGVYECEGAGLKPTKALAKAEVAERVLNIMQQHQQEQQRQEQQQQEHQQQQHQQLEQQRVVPRYKRACPSQLKYRLRKHAETLVTLPDDPKFLSHLGGSFRGAFPCNMKQIRAEYGGFATFARATLDLPTGGSDGGGSDDDEKQQHSDDEEAAVAPPPPLFSPPQTPPRPVAADDLRNEVDRLGRLNVRLAEELEDLRTTCLCAICVQKPRDTLLMPCLHVLCGECLSQYRDHAPPGLLSDICPYCSTSVNSKLKFKLTP